MIASGISNTHQWQKNFVPIPGATSASYAIASAQLTDNGTYTVTVTNPCGTQTSAGAVDLDGINGQDMVVAAYASGTLEVALNNSASLLIPRPPVPVAAGLSGLAAADFDGDGRFDVAT